MVIKYGKTCTLSYEALFRNAWDGNYILCHLGEGFKPYQNLKFMVPLYDGNNTGYMANGILTIHANGDVELNTLGKAYNLNFAVTWVCG